MDIYVLDRNFSTVAIVDTFISTIWTDRFWECGDFEIKVLASRENLDIFQEDYYLWREDSDHMMIIEETTLDSDAEAGAQLLIKGRSLESILDRRVIWGKKTISGSLQDSIETLLNENLINPSDGNRKIDGFQFKKSTDSRITALTVDAQYTGDDLYTVISDLCKTANIGFRVLMPTDGTYEFSLYAGVDRSYDQSINPYIIFSPNFENLMNSNCYSSKKEYKTVSLVGGPEETDPDTDITTQEFVSAEIDSGGGSGLNRREMYTSASDVRREVDGEEIPIDEYRAQLVQKGKEALTEHIITKTFDGEAELSRSFTYGVDFYMGDIVQNENEYDQIFTSRITEYIWSEDESEVKQYPTFTVIEEGGN